MKLARRASALLRVSDPTQQQISRELSVSHKVLEKAKASGSICAPFTPFKKNGDVNYDLIPQHVEYMKKLEVPSVFLNGTTGEGLSLTVSERKKTTEAWYNNRQHLHSIMVHIGAPNNRDSQELASHAESIKADSIACIAPSYFKPQSIKALVEYMTEVAQAAPNTPFYLYDINFMTNIYLNLEEFLKEAEAVIPTLTGIKHSSPELSSLLRCHRVAGGKYHILLGSDDTMLPVMAMGLEDSVPSPFMSPLHNRIREAYKSGDMALAQELQYKCMQISNARAKYATGAGLFTVSRAMMKMIGLDLGPPRLPLEPMNQEDYEALEAELRQLGFFKAANC